MPVHAALDLSETHKSSGCQTSAYCSAATEECQGVGGGTKENPWGETGVHEQKRHVPTPVQKITENSEFEVAKEGC